MPSEEAAPAMSRSAKVSLRSAIIAAVAMMATFAAAALPIPLYADYQATLGLTDSDVSLTTVYYLAGVLVVLFMGGSLSDALGRKPMVAASLAFGALGCAVFAVAAGIIPVGQHTHAYQLQRPIGKRQRGFAHQLRRLRGHHAAKRCP